MRWRITASIGLNEILTDFLELYKEFRKEEGEDAYMWRGN